MRQHFGFRAVVAMILMILTVVITGCCGLVDARSAGQRRLRPTSTPPVAVSASEEERLLVALYERVNPSVVNIAVAARVLPQGESQSPSDSEAPDEFMQRGEGSGFVIDSKGHIVTNNHVVAGADQVRVTFSDDVSALATVVGTDPDSDLAVIKVDVPSSELYPLVMGDSDALKVGQRVIAIGNPFGLEGTMTTGIVSALGRLLPAGGDTTEGARYRIPDVIQTDAAVNPGNSGGPLLDLEGQVVGVTSAIESPVPASAGIGLAIPSSIVKKVVPALIASGHYQHAWLGISAVTVGPTLAKAMGFPEDQRGVLVATITPGSPAERAKLQPSQDTVRVDGLAMPSGGDIIVGIEGKPIRKYDDLISYLTRYTEVGQTVRLSVLRDGHVVEVEVTLAARPGTT
jgi:2-alkenal reductase